MLDFLRRKATSYFAWIILGVLALVFGLSFGLPQDAAISLGKPALVKVFGTRVDLDTYTYEMQSRAFVGLPTPEQVIMQMMMRVKEDALETAVEREVFAHEAEELGLATTQTDAEDLALDGYHIMRGLPLRTRRNDTAFDYDTFRRVILGNLQIAEKRYFEVQSRELLALTMRDILRALAVVPPSQVRQQFEAEANELSLRYAMFSPADYADFVDPTDADLHAYISAHQDELTTRYEREKTQFEGLPSQAHVWLLQTSSRRDAAAARQRLATEPFATLARALSEHGSARRGGDMGWLRSSDLSAFPEVVQAAWKDMPVGTPSNVLAAPDKSFYIIMVSERREGDVAQDSVFREYAVQAIKNTQGRVLAEQAAKDALLALQAGKTFGEVFRLSSDTATSGAARFRAELQETGLFAKGGRIPGIGEHPSLVEAAWASEGPMLLQVWDGEDGNKVLAGLVEKKVATDDDFETSRTERYRQLAAAQGFRLAQFWAHRACLKGKARGDIVPSPVQIKRVVRYDLPEKDGAASMSQPPYEVCDRVGELPAGMGGFR